MVLVVSEAHMLHDDVSAHGSRHIGICVIRRLRLGIHDGKYSLRAGQCREDRGHGHGDLVDRTPELTGIVQEDGKSSDIKASEYTEDAADDCGQGIGDLGGAVHDRAHDAAEELCLDLICLQLFIEDVEFFLCDLLMVEDLDHLLSGDGFLHIAVERTQGRLLQGVVLSGGPGNGRDRLEHQRDHKYRDQCQYHIGVKHERQSTCQREPRRKDGDQRRAQHVSDIVDIVCETAHQVAAGVAVIETDRKLLHMVEEILPHPLQAVLADAHQKTRLQVSGDNTRHIDREHDDQRPEEPGRVSAAPVHGNDIGIDDRAQHIGRRKRGNGRDQHTDQGSCKARLFLQHIGHQACDGMAHILRSSALPVTGAASTRTAASSAFSYTFSVSSFKGGCQPFCSGHAGTSSSLSIWL